MVIFILGDLMQNIDGACAQMPVLEGPKKSIVECNYVAESLLRYIRNLHMNSLYRVNKILHSDRDGETINGIWSRKVGESELSK